MRLLRRDGDPLARIRPGFTRRFTIYDDDDQLAIIKAAYRALGLDEKEFMQYRAALSRISHAKNTKQTPQDLYKQAVNKETEALAAVFEEYEKALRNANALDFDDLLLEAVRLLQHDDATREAWNRRLSYVMVDEYQDTNRSQYELMRLLSEAHRNVCVVGDEDQSIYSWRGADIRNILDFERDFPNAQHHPAGAELPLDQEHSGGRRRGGGEQQGAQGQEALDRSRGGRQAGPLRRPTTPKTRRCSSPTPSRSTWRRNPGDHVAVLYRTNFQSRQIEEALRRYGRKYNVVGGFSFYQRAEIKDMVAYLKLAVVEHGFGQPAAHHQHAGARHRPHHGGADRTATRGEHGLSLWDAIERIIDDAAALHPLAIVAGDFPQSDPGAFAGGQLARRCRS